MKFLPLLTLLLAPVSWADDTSCSGALIDSVDDSAHPARLRHAAGDEEPAIEGVVIVPGDTLTTGGDSTVDLSLCDGSQIRVGPNSEYFLDQASDTSTVTELLRGTVRARVTPATTPAETVRFQVRTPTGVIGVRGTEFLVEESDGESQLFTLEGEVLYGGEDMVNEMRKPLSEIQSRLTLVKKGEQSRITRGTRVPVRPQTFQRTAIEKRPVFRRTFQAKPTDLFQRQRQMIRARVQQRMKKSPPPPRAARQPIGRKKTEPPRLAPTRKGSLQPKPTKQSPLKRPPTRLEKSKVLSQPSRPTNSIRVSPMAKPVMQKRAAPPSRSPPPTKHRGPPPPPPPPRPQPGGGKKPR